MTKKGPRGIFERPAGSGVWWARYTDEFGREHREKVGRKAFALKVYQKRKTEVQERRYFPTPQPSWDPPFASWIADYLARRTSTLRDPGGAERYGRDLRDAPELRGKTMRALTAHDFERYRERRRRGGAPGARRRRGGASASTVNKELSFARAVCNDFIEALEDQGGAPIGNPVRTRLFAAEPAGRTRYLTEAEEERLRGAIGEADWPKLLVAMHTGLDRGAQLSLRWEQVDFQARLIHAERRKGRRDGVTPVTIAINAELLATLRALPSRLTSPYVFPNAEGTGPLDGPTFDRLVFRPARRRAGLRDLRWKDLRHTFASRLRMHGVELATIRDLMGHTTTRMTERYAHIAPGHLHAAVERLSRTGTTTGTSECDGSEPARAVAGKRPTVRGKIERPRRDSNPRYRRERPVS